MHRKMVAAVARMSSQRHTPESLRTRVTSPSTGPAVACGSANSTLAGGAAGGPALWALLADTDLPFLHAALCGACFAARPPPASRPPAAEDRPAGGAREPERRRP